MGGPANDDQAAVLDVRGDDRSRGCDEGVIGVVQVPGSGARGPGVPIAEGDARRRDVDDADHEVVLLRDDYLAPVGREERVVGQLEGLTRQLPGFGEAPEYVARRGHLHKPVVVAIGDQHRARQHAGIRAGAQVSAGPQLDGADMRQRRSWRGDAAGAARRLRCSPMPAPGRPRRRAKPPPRPPPAVGV